GDLRIMAIPEQQMNGGGKMTRAELVRILAESASVSQSVVNEILDSYAAIAVSETKKKGVFVIPGIGRLVSVERKARLGRNPATGEAIKIPVKKVVKFRVAKSMKDALTPRKKK